MNGIVVSDRSFCTYKGCLHVWCTSLRIKGNPLSRLLLYHCRCSLEPLFFPFRYDASAQKVRAPSHNTTSLHVRVCVCAYATLPYAHTHSPDSETPHALRHVSVTVHCLGTQSPFSQTFPPFQMPEDCRNGRSSVT